MRKLFFIICLFCSCNIEKDAHFLENNKVGIEESDSTLSLPIDDKTRITTLALHYFQDADSVEYISLENENYNSRYGVIHYYRLDSCSLDHTVVLNYEGPNVVAPPICGHTTLKRDEIMVSVDVQKIIYKVNSKGEILHTYTLFDGNTGEDLYLPCNFMSMEYNPLISIGNYFYIGLELPAEEQFPMDDHIIDFDKYPLILKVDTLTGDLECSKLHFPKLYDVIDGVGHLNWYSHIYDGVNFVFSFDGLDSIYVSNDLQSFKSYYAKSNYIENIKNVGYSRSIDGSERSLRYHSRPRYGNIIYDQFRNYYYRFCFLYDDKVANGNYSDFSNTNYKMCHGEFTIQIIDNKFNVIGETKFPRGKYVPMYFFVNKCGLWMSENNYERNDISDDWLVFRCFNIVEYEK